MSNPFRNEVDITLGDKSYRLRATFDFIAEIENYFDKSMYEIVMLRMAGGKVRAHEVKAILVAGIKAAGDKPNESEVEQSILTEGLVSAITKLAPFLGKVFEGSPVEKEEKKA